MTEKGEAGDKVPALAQNYFFEWLGGERVLHCAESTKS